MKDPTYTVNRRLPKKLRPHRDFHPWMEPFEAYRSLRNSNSVLLESVSAMPRTARYSIIALEPIVTFTAKDGVITIVDETGPVTITGDPLNLIKQTLESYELSGDQAAKTGAVGYIGYDACRHIESLPVIAEDDLYLPDMLFFIPRHLLWFDHLKKELEIVTLASDREKTDPVDEVRKIKSSLSNKNNLICRLTKKIRRAEFLSNFSKKDFEQAVLCAKDYIFAGDIYQVNLSQRLTAELSIDPIDVYKNLRNLNPSPFAAFFDLGDWQMVGCSPERLVSLKEGIVETRPIAGTIRRGREGIEDRRYINELIRDIKERAEHIMLVDLERNDLGRVCDYGSIAVDELMVTESYSHVTHIVSNVTGRLNREKTFIDLIRACFPGGTITGCPKVRSMEIIEELEPVRRGPYTGSMGYINFNGDLDLNIIIRTLIIKNGLAHVQAGAGIVADSIPSKEYRETLYKAEALIRATRQATENHGV